MIETRERIKEVRTALGLTMEKFGEHLGVGKTAISLLESGKNNLTEQMAKSICREFNVDYLWLTTGEGDMFIELAPDEEIIKYSQDLLEDKDSAVASVIKDFIVMYYSKLDDTSKEVLNRIAADLLENQVSKKEKL